MLQVVSRWTGIPVDRLQQTEIEKLLHLKDMLHARVVGQDLAVEAVADTVLRSRAGLASRNRGSSFLFLVCPIFQFIFTLYCCSLHPLPSWHILAYNVMFSGRSKSAAFLSQ